MRLAAHVCECPDCGSTHNCAERDIPFEADGSIAYSFTLAVKNDGPGWTVHKAGLEYILSNGEMKQSMDVLAGDPGPGLAEQDRYATFDPSVHILAWREEGNLKALFR